MAGLALKLFSYARQSSTMKFTEKEIAKITDLFKYIALDANVDDNLAGINSVPDTPRLNSVVAFSGDSLYIRSPRAIPFPFFPTSRSPILIFEGVQHGSPK